MSAQEPWSVCHLIPVASTDADPQRIDLYSHTDDKFHFLELNPRLQVEHPTTEIISGVNLPAAQLQIAMGLPLHRIRDIRMLYGLAPNGTNAIDFDFEDPSSILNQRKPTAKGHVVAVRITAENPEAGFKPSSGALQELNFRSNTNVWGYFSVGTAGGLHEFADSQVRAGRAECRKRSHRQSVRTYLCIWLRQV